MDYENIKENNLKLIEEFLKHSKILKQKNNTQMLAIATICFAKMKENKSFEIEIEKMWKDGFKDFEDFEKMLEIKKLDYKDDNNENPNEGNRP